MTAPAQLVESQERIMTCVYMRIETVSQTSGKFSKQSF